MACGRHGHDGHGQARLDAAVLGVRHTRVLARRVQLRRFESTRSSQFKAKVAARLFKPQTKFALWVRGNRQRQKRTCTLGVISGRCVVYTRAGSPSSSSPPVANANWHEMVRYRASCTRATQRDISHHTQRLFASPVRLVRVWGCGRVVTDGAHSREPSASTCPLIRYHHRHRVPRSAVPGGLGLGLG